MRNSTGRPILRCRQVVGEVGRIGRSYLPRLPSASSRSTVGRLAPLLPRRRHYARAGGRGGDHRAAEVLGNMEAMERAIELGASARALTVEDAISTAHCCASRRTARSRVSYSNQPRPRKPTEELRGRAGRLQPGRRRSVVHQLRGRCPARRTGGRADGAVGMRGAARARRRLRAQRLDALTCWTALHSASAMSY